MITGTELFGNLGILAGFTFSSYTTLHLLVIFLWHHKNRIYNLISHAYTQNFWRKYVSFVTYGAKLFLII